MNKKPVIDIRDLSYRYPDGSCGLESVSLQVYAGECLGIVGPNGAGKSTLLSHLNGILLGSGTLWVAGFKVERKHLADVRRKVGLVFQNPEHQLFMPSLMDDVMFGPLNFGMPEETARKKAEAVLREMALWEKRQRSPLHLSLGEKKKAALATVLVMDPAIVALDEPLVSLDPGSRKRMLRRIDGLAATRIIATHDLDMVLQVCHRVVLMDHGTVLAVGHPHDLLSRRKLLEAHDLEVPACLRQPKGEGRSGI